MWKALKNISFLHFWKLCKLFLQHPKYSISSFWATYKTLQICQTKFGNKHFGNGKENAFRHALWNVLLCFYSGKDEKAIQWAKIFTDYHEEIFANTTFDKEMDLHNNAIGRNLFAEHINSELTHKELVEKLEVFLESAISISWEESEKTAENFQNTLIYVG